MYPLPIFTKRLTLAIGFALAAGPAAADDGGNGINPGSPFQKSMSQKLQSDFPDGVAEHAFVDVMNRYVPAQAASGVDTLVEHYDIDGTLVETLEEAKPQIGVFLFGPVEHVPDSGLGEIGFTGHGKREAYAAVSLDDGNTWKLTNLSESADRSSADFDRETDREVTIEGEDFTIPAVDLYEDDGINYPGDVLNVAQATAGDRAIVAWFSRYCGSGQPNYSLSNEDNPENLARRDAIAAYLGIDLGTPSADDLYLTDMFRVAGQQQSVDYGEDRFDKNRVVGEVPYNCLWAARGTLEEGDNPATAETEAYHIVWRKAERLTSGRRDVNRVEADMVEGVGAVITWQEDPEGLRPGQGLGPGAGWSGAVANSQTDVWYSFIEWDHFGQLQDDTDPTLIREDYSGYLANGGTSGRPKVGIPMAMPMRASDNAKCNVTNPAPYCHGSAADLPEKGVDDLDPLAYGMKDMCADTVQVPTGQDDELSPVCVTEDGLPLLGNIAATRPRVRLFGYDSDNDGVDDSGWVVFQVEESKGLGRFGVDAEGIVGCDPEAEGCEQFDVGKNMWYHTFSMSLFDDRVTEDNGLLANLSDHGNMLNQPAVDWQTGTFFPVVNTLDLWDFGAYNYEIYQTEIARRGSILAQNADNIQPGSRSGGVLAGWLAAVRDWAQDRRDPDTDAGPFPRLRDYLRVGRPGQSSAGTVAFPAWKQGIMQQGGPADVMARRILLPLGYREGTDNPYAFTNMGCDTWAYADGSNPYYPDGLCLDTAVNLSSVTPDTCVDTATGAGIECPSVDQASGIGDTNPILSGRNLVGDPNTQKVLTWHQCPNDASVVSSSDDVTPVTACEDSPTNRADNITDQSWYNPLDVAKGHRGFIDGDFIMMLYAWSPNWKLNTNGRDRYELYIRRSFDGGETWTTLPRNYVHLGNPGETPVTFQGEGTVDCESFRRAEVQAGGDVDEPKACFGYDAGGAQQARNVSQLKSLRFTVLDPRYSETAPTIPDTGREEDIRDPSRYFIVYETGDNRTVEFGEAESLDLFYSRGVQFGDNYQVWAEEDDLSVCYPSDPHDDPDVSDVVAGSGFCNEFDELEGKRDIASGEGSIESNPGGEWLYAVWSQDDETSGESDAMWRRVWYIDDYISTDYAWDVVGQGQDPADF